MKTSAAKTIFVFLLIVLLLLAAVSGFVWWRTTHNQGGVAAQQQAAAELKSLQAAVRSSGVAGSQKDSLESDLHEQLDALNRSAVEDAQPEEDHAPQDVPGLAQRMTQSSQRIYDLASNTGLSSDESATLTSISVGQWATVQLLNGTLAEVDDPSSAASRELKDLTGLGQNEALKADGLCPAMSDDAKDKASGGAGSQQADDGSNAEDSENLTKVLTGLYTSTWSESYFQARQDVDNIPKDTSDRIVVAAKIHSSQLQQLRAGLDQNCSAMPQPKAAYKLPHGAARDPGKIMAEQADHLGSESIGVIRSQKPGKSDAQGSGSWTAWGARSLALNTAISTQISGDVPALPGIS
ncbi:hypothetical protein [Rothia uropygioeca]|uniref:hypothetical protein n=1 Tax=Kocuria sp. 257 TaxID=2021970 RepID=UPI0010139B5D|nr:hypothetical protein [Kocuria sp. 257]